MAEDAPSILGWLSVLYDRFAASPLCERKPMYCVAGVLAKRIRLGGGNVAVFDVIRMAQRYQKTKTRCAAALANASFQCLQNIARCLNVVNQ